MKVDKTKLGVTIKEPINISSAAEVNDGDVIYVFQHLDGNEAVYISSSQCIVKGR